MSDKKRKSASKGGERPSKKQQTTSTVRVTHVAGPDVAKPVVAFSPGISFPDVTFESFVKQNAHRNNLLLRSSKHPSLDHIAHEGDSSIENYLKHYIAVFDPNTGALKVTEAKHLTVRTSLRPVVSAQEDENESEDENAPVANYTSRAALTEAFGTKKSKKAVQTMAENRQLAQGSEGANNPISTAMLANVVEDEDLSNEVSLSDTLGNKPLPAPDLGTNQIDKVYSLERLVVPGPADNTLEMMPINTWTARISAKKSVQTRSRFVANRVVHLVANTDSGKSTKATQVLRYIQLLLDIHTYITHLPKHKPIPPVSEWPEKTMSPGTPAVLLRSIISHFFPDRRPKEYTKTLLRTTILALTLHIPPPSFIVKTGTLVTEPTDVSLDMAIDSADIRKLYRELGCGVGPATEKELDLWGLQRLGKQKKDEAGITRSKPTFARLKFPLDFPKLSRGRPLARR